MAPSTKGSNPAPNYTVAMNQVQTQIEAQLRIVRSFMPSSRAPASSKPTTSTTSTTAPVKPTPPSFSALASTTTLSSKFSSPNLPGSRQRQQEEDSLFAETRAQDPNAGLGFGVSSKRAAERAKERETQVLRSRLLGRKRGAEDASGRAQQRRREDSSDEEPGRSGLGRAKKRARREPESREEGEGEGGEGCRGIPEGITGQPEVQGPVESEKLVATQSSKGSVVTDGDENVEAREEENGEIDMGIAPGTNTLPADSIPAGAEGASDEKTKKRKKKKKNKKKDKSKEDTAE